MKIKIIIVEDERIVAFNLKQRLMKLGYDVPAIAINAEQAMRSIELNKPNLVLMDINIKGAVDGIDTASNVMRKYKIPIIYLTGYSDDAVLARARATRPYGYLLKPMSERELHATIQMALERHGFEAALDLSEARLRLALSAADMTGFILDDLKGKPPYFLAVESVPAENKAAMEEVLAKGGKWRGETKVLKKDGSFFQPL